MLLQVAQVGRKTPRDGKLEISPETARRLASLGETIPIRVGAMADRANVTSMACTCGKGGNGDHRHFFLASELLRGLVVDQTVALELSDDNGVIVALPHPP